MKNTKQEEREWTNKELLEFYRSFSPESFTHACLQDREMKTFIHTACYYIRTAHTGKIHFDQLNENFIKDMVTMSFQTFLIELEEKIKQKEPVIFYWIFKDSDLFLRGGIYSMEEAVYAMRDEVLGIYLDLLINRIGLGLYDSRERVKKFNNILKFNPETHTGTKYTCYKNHLLAEWYAQMILGSSMIFQGIMTLEEAGDFDTYCDKFEPYFSNIMRTLKIKENSLVEKKSFSRDIRRIMNYVLKGNSSLIDYNYEAMEL